MPREIDQRDPLRSVCEVRQPERGLARGRGQHHALGAEKIVLAKVIVDQERQHEQRPQRRLMVALLPCEIGLPLIRA